MKQSLKDEREVIDDLLKMLRMRRGRHAVTPAEALAVTTLEGVLNGERDVVETKLKGFRRKRPEPALAG